VIHTANALQTAVKSKPTPTLTDLRPKVDNLNATLQEAVAVRLPKDAAGNFTINGLATKDLAAATILAVVASAAMIGIQTQMSQYALVQTYGTTAASASAGSASNPVMVDPSQREERIGRMKAGHTHTQIFALRKEILHGRTLRCR